MKTPHRQLQRCTWPTSLPRFNFVGKIVRAGVHDQLWQNFFGKGMWKKQLSALSFQPSVRTLVSSRCPTLRFLKGGIPRPSPSLRPSAKLERARSQQNRRRPGGNSAAGLVGGYRLSGTLVWTMIFPAPALPFLEYG